MFILFLEAVGTSAGAEIASTLEQYGVELFLMGANITILPMLLALYAGKYLFKMNLFNLFGAISGGMTSSQTLAPADSMTDTNAHPIACATAYPVAMVLLIVVEQLLNLVFKGSGF